MENATSSLGMVFYSPPKGKKRTYEAWKSRGHHVIKGQHAVGLHPKNGKPVFSRDQVERNEPCWSPLSSYESASVGNAVKKVSEEVKSNGMCEGYHLLTTWSDGTKHEEQLSFEQAHAYNNPNKYGLGSESWD